MNGGGAERVLLDILNNFDYAKYNVDLLQINGGGVLIDEIPQNINVIETWHGYPMSYRIALALSNKIGIDAFLKQRIEKVLSGKHYDVAISFLEGMPTKAHSLIMKHADRNYSWVHCDLEKFPYEADLFRGDSELETYNKMNSVICVAKDTELALHRRFPLLDSPTKVIYNPIDFEKIKKMAAKHNVANKEFTIVVCGRLTPPKKIDRVLRLAQRLKANNHQVKIQLIGDGELRTELQFQAKELDVTDIVEFVGFTRNPYPYIKSSQLLLSTSCAEGFSLVICEAMTLGVPVIATRTAGPVQILDDNKYGLLCDHDDDSIYNAVCRMIDDEGLRTQYSIVGKKRVEEFSILNTMTEIYKL